ncbi:MAG: hypothetical protein AAF492_11930, partial [Verrucomicrobiota bacterium]
PWLGETVPAREIRSQLGKRLGTQPIRTPRAPAGTLAGLEQRNIHIPAMRLWPHVHLAPGGRLGWLTLQFTGNNALIG